MDRFSAFDLTADLFLTLISFVAAVLVIRHQSVEGASEGRGEAALALFVTAFVAGVVALFLFAVHAGETANPFRSVSLMLSADLNLLICGLSVALGGLFLAGDGNRLHPVLAGIFFLLMAAALCRYFWTALAAVDGMPSLRAPDAGARLGLFFAMANGLMVCPALSAVWRISRRNGPRPGILSGLGPFVGYTLLVVVLSALTPTGAITFLHGLTPFWMVLLMVMLFSVLIAWMIQVVPPLRSHDHRLGRPPRTGALRRI